MAVFDPGTVLIRKELVSKDGFIKDRWLVVSGVYNRYGIDYYILFYCTTSPISFPSATKGCNSIDNEHCYVFEAKTGKFEFKTYVSLLEPANYNLDFGVADFENAATSNIVKFKLSKAEFLDLLLCAKASKTLKKYIISKLNSLYEELRPI